MNEIPRLQEWLQNKLNSNWKLYVKRLSANDTGATGGHQSGIYIPNKVMQVIFPEMQSHTVKNPDHKLQGCIESHLGPDQSLRAIYYNNKFSEGKTRDEQRVTCWKDGFKETPLSDPEYTGSIALFAFNQDKNNKNSDLVSVWICDNSEQEDFIENMIEEIVPGNAIFCHGNTLNSNLLYELNKANQLQDIPDSWKVNFPTGKEIIEYVFQNNKIKGTSSDEKILNARKIEFDVFKRIEEVHFLPVVEKGFSTVDEFVSLANSISNRRKSRSGKSLEHHLEIIFKERSLSQYDAQCKTEQKKKPDFIFPSSTAYHDTSYPKEKLNMLAVKTTCKDRWRQILNEANRIPEKYLFTLQEGVSENQFDEMTRSGVTLVVPKPLIKKFPESTRDKILTLDQFINKMLSTYE